MNKKLIVSAATATFLVLGVFLFVAWDNETAKNLFDRTTASDAAQKAIEPITPVETVISDDSKPKDLIKEPQIPAPAKPYTHNDNDEGVMIVELNEGTIQICRGAFDREEHLCVKYNQESPVKMNGDLRIKDIQGFEFDNNFTYKLEVERIRSNQYGTLDGQWYEYKLLRIIEATRI